MKKGFQGKQKKRKKKVLFFLFMLLIGIILSYRKLSDSNIKITNKEFIHLITSNTFKENNSIINTIVNKTIEASNPIKKMNQDYQKYVIKEMDTKAIKVEETPLIYLYNTHQTEEYAPSNFIEYNVNPTVIINNYIMQDIFTKNSLPTIVEESSIKEILNTNNWNYSYSYKASRILMEQAKQKNPTLEYFIDIHRDSLRKDRTTISIDGKDYAKVLFIVGLENPNYEKNLQFTEKIQKKLEEYYPSLSKGIYQKSGSRVNGIYNQDFSEHTILIEIGGYENTTQEVLNSSLAFAKCFMEVIHE